MTGFDKIAALITIPIGAAFLILGAIGLFFGSSAHFTLPPILGGLPLILGWSMCVTLIRFWLKDPKARSLRPGGYAEFIADDPSRRDLSDEAFRVQYLQWELERLQAERPSE